MPTTTLTTASVTSSTNRTRFYTEPPYASVLSLAFVCKNRSGEIPVRSMVLHARRTQLERRHSPPQSRTARTYSSISSTVNARGSDVLLSFLVFGGIGIGLGATCGWPTFCRTSGSAARLRTHSWRYMNDPFSCTASAICSKKGVEKC